MQWIYRLRGIQPQRRPHIEGPSLIIACEELAPFKGERVKSARGSAAIPKHEISGSRFLGASSWGKHLLLRFTPLTIRIHFLMFGSYRIGNPRPNRTPKLTLSFASHKIYFYSCAIKVLDEDPSEIYDWSVDVMSKKWKPRRAITSVAKCPSAMVCDIILDQMIFSGAGNIIKNEVLFNLRLHPETRVKFLQPTQISSLVREVRRYSLRFYKWKKINQLKRHWQIFRKKYCPICGGTVSKCPTGNLKRISHFCAGCQRKL